MTPQCQTVLDQLSAGGLAESSQSHAQRCPRCRDVVAAYRQTEDAAARRVEPPAQAKLEKIRAITRDELAAHPKATPWRKRAAQVFAVYAALGLLGAVALGIRWSHLQGTDGLTLWSAGALLIAIIGGGVFLGLAPARHAAVNLFLPAAFVGALLIAFGGVELATAKTFLQEGIPCLTTEVAMSVLPLAIAAWVMVQSAFNLRRTVAVGIAAATTGLLTLHLHCEQGRWEHLLVFHVLPAFALVLLFIGVRRALPTKSYAP